MTASPMPPQYRAGVETTYHRTLTTTTYQVMYLGSVVIATTQVEYLRSVAPATNQVTCIRSDDLAISHEMR